MVRYCSLDTHKTTETGDAKLPEYSVLQLRMLYFPLRITLVYCIAHTFILRTCRHTSRVWTLVVTFAKACVRPVVESSSSHCARDPASGARLFRSPSRANATYRTDLFTRTDSIRPSIAQCDCVRVFPPAIPSVRPSVRSAGLPDLKLSFINPATDSVDLPTSPLFAPTSSP